MDLRHIFLLMALMLSINVNAQRETISGRVIDNDSGDPLEKATLQLYRITTRRNNVKDTTFVGGALSSESGTFSFSDVRSGTYFLKVTYLGYKDYTRNINKTSSHQALGTIPLEPNSVEIQEAIVVANIPKMVIKDDTVVYNADAFRVPEGSVIEALVEVLPGAKIDDDGKITVNGKEVKKFKLDGRDFMTGNNDAVMKNLPSYVIDKVKAYDEKSDLSRMTGVDDGNDDFVLEFTTKRSARNGIQANPDLGIGTDQRYGVRLTAMKPFGAMRYTFMGNANNVNDRNFSGRGGRGRGNGQGQRHTKTGALDASYEDQRKPNGEQLKVSGRVTWTHNNTNNWNRSASENFVNTRGGAFSNSVSQSYSRNNSWTGNMNLQWTIDSLTTLSFRPNVSISSNDNQNGSTSASFNADPYDYVTNPLSREDLNTLSKDSLVVNSRENKSLSYGNNKNLSSQVQLYRRMNSKGRNIAFSGNSHRIRPVRPGHIKDPRIGTGGDDSAVTKRASVLRKHPLLRAVDQVEHNQSVFGVVHINLGFVLRSANESGQVFELPGLLHLLDITPFRFVINETADPKRFPGQFAFFLRDDLISSQDAHIELRPFEDDIPGSDDLIPRHLFAFRSRLDRFILRGRLQVPGKDVAFLAFVNTAGKHMNLLPVRRIRKLLFVPGTVIHNLIRLDLGELFACLVGRFSQ